MLNVGGYILAFKKNYSGSTIKKPGVFRKSAYASTVILSLLVLAILCPLYLIPNFSEAAAGTAAESTLTFTFVNNKNTASVSLNVSGAAGSFATSASNELAEFSLTTNNATGYTLNLKTSGATTTLSDGTNSINTISGTKTANNFAVNTWGLLPSKYNGAANTTNYYPASSAGFTIDTTSTANTTANTYTIGLGIKADFTTQAGVYTSANTDNGNTGVSLVLEYVANPVNYSITYDKGNITGTPSNIPSAQSGSIASTGITLSSTVPSITGYTFTGWCLGTVTTPANETDTCSGTVYNPNGNGTNLSFGIDQTISSNTATLHAMWSRVTVAITVNFAGSGVTGVTFINTTYGNINTTTSGSIANLKYGVQYTISGSYNTNYEFSSWTATAGTLGSTSSASTTYSSTATATLTLTGKHGPYCSSSDSNCMQYVAYASCGQTLMDARDGNTYTTAEINDLCWMTKNLNLPGGTVLTPELTNVPNNYSTNTTGFTNGNTLPASSTTGFVNNAAAYVYNTGSTTCANSSPCYSYYSWRAATAGYNTSTDGTSPSYDICPKGWRLPTSSEATALRNKYNYGTSLNASPFTGVYSAYYYNSAFTGGGTYGFYWTSTSYDGSFAYYLFYSSSYSTVANDGNKSNGNAIRCVKERPYMQNQTTASLTALMPNNGDSTTLYDKRDGKDYTVKKINGQYWMTQNLRTTGTVSAADSNFTGSNFNISQYSLASSDSSFSGHCDSTNGYNYACAKDSGSTTTGVWYNYYSATAGTIATNNNENDATSDICPAGWHLPTGPNTTANTDFNKLVGNTISEGQSATAGLTAFNAVPGGIYSDGTLYVTGRATWWGATSGNVVGRYDLSYDSSNNQFTGDDNNIRFCGFFIRCVKS